MSRRRRPTRVGDILPGAAAELGLSDELRLARLMAAWSAIVGEHLPRAAGRTRLVALDGATIVVETDHALVGSELRLNEPNLLRAVNGLPYGAGIGHMRIRIRPARR